MGHGLTAMFLTAEVMFQLPIWHPEKWETKDDGAKARGAAFNRHTRGEENKTGLVLVCNA